MCRFRDEIKKGVLQHALHSPEICAVLQLVLLPPSAVPHISQPPVPKSRGLTAEGELSRRGKRGHPGVSPRGEKPCPISYDVRYIVKHSDSHQRLLPRGRSCQKSALRNRFLTDVGDSRAKSGCLLPPSNDQGQTKSLPQSKLPQFVRTAQKSPYVGNIKF